MNRNVYLLAIATFSAATEGSVFVGLLPQIAQDLGTTTGAAGQLSAAFSIAFAITAPVTVNFAAKYNQKRVLTLSLLVLAILNFVASGLHDFLGLMAVRISCGLVAPLVIPVSFGSAAKMAAPEQRGRALAIVQLGFIFANFVGIPLGTVLGGAFGWRASFLFAGAIAVASAILLQKFIPNIDGSTGTSPKNLLLGLQRNVLENLSIIALAETGVFAAVSFIAPITEKIAGFQGNALALVQATVAAGMFFGAKWGGKYADKGKSDEVIPAISLGLSVALFSFSVLMGFAPAHDLFSGLAFVVALNTAVFFMMGMIPNIQYRLISFSPEHRATLMALNSSSIFIGQGLGAVIGGIVLDHTSVSYLGYAGSGLNLIGFLIGAMMLARLPVAGEAQVENTSPQNVSKAA